MNHGRACLGGAAFMVLGLFAVSCALPAGSCYGGFLEGGVAPDGWHLAFFGWLVLPLEGFTGLAWFANPSLVAGLVCLWRRSYAWAVVWAGLAACLGLLPLALLPDSWVGEVRLKPVPAWVFRDGRLEFRAGYFCWVASHALLLTVAVLWWRRSRAEAAPMVPLNADD